MLKDDEYTNINKLLEDCGYPILLGRNVTLYQRANINGNYFTSTHYKREKRQNNHTYNSSLLSIIVLWINRKIYICQYLSVSKSYKGIHQKGIPYQVESGLITEESSLLLFEDYITFTKDTQIYVFAHHIIEKCINLTVGTSQLLTQRVNNIEIE